VKPPRAGVVGTGAMGLGIAASLVRSGIETYARDIDPRAAAAAGTAGAHVLESAAALGARAEVALLVVVDDRQIDSVLFDPDGIAGAMPPGGIVVVCSTVDPRFVEELAPRLARHRLSLVDAPISGGPARAAEGTMTMMVAGEAAARSRCRPLFEAMAGRVFDVGDTPGQAATFKIVNNLLAAANLAAGAEALALARRAGLEPRSVLEVIGASSGASWIVADRMSRALAGDHGVRAAARILAKDASIATALARRLGACDRFATAAARSFAEAVEAGLGEADDSVLLALFERAGGGPERTA
jgi:3-hydroxyisobutyrate dehydrogenase-like beta-hydroxyacid dehydrogenase